MKMNIWCSNNKEVRVTLAQLEKRGCKWYGNEKPTQWGMSMPKATICCDNGTLTYSSNKYGDAVEASKLYSNLLR